MNNLSPAQKLLFVIIPVIAVILFFEFSLRKTDDTYARKKEIFEKHKSSARVLITGNSQALYGVNPDVLSVPSLNMAFVNQDIWYDVQMIQTAMTEMRELKVVLLQLNYLSFGYRLDKVSEAWRCGFYFSRWGFQKPYDDVLLRDYSFLALYTPRIALSRFRYHLKPPSGFPMSGRGFERVSPKYSVLVNDSSARFWVRRHNAFMDLTNHQRNFDLLRTLARRLQKKNILFVVFSSPLSPDYQRFGNHTIIIKNEAFIKRLISENAAFYWDFRGNSSFQRQDFLDDYHLNANGAAKLSHKIDSCLLRLGI